MLLCALEEFITSNIFQEIIGLLDILERGTKLYVFHAMLTDTF
jgi:hypothetical protein